MAFPSLNSAKLVPSPPASEAVQTAGPLSLEATPPVLPEDRATRLAALGSFLGSELIFSHLKSRPVSERSSILTSFLLFASRTVGAPPS